MTADTPSPLVPRLRFPEFEEEADWSARPLTNVVRSISSGLSLTQTNGSNGVRVTRIETIADGTVDINKVGRVTTDQNISSYRLSIGDILVSNINSTSHIGKSVHIDRDYDLYHGMNLLRIQALSDVIYSQFLYYWLNTEIVRASIRSRANKAVNQASINQTELGKTVVLLPLLVEQQKIADCLGSLDELIAAEGRKLEALRQHKQGLMQQLFPQPGETVPRLRFPEFRDASDWKTGRCRDIARVLPGYGFPDKFQGNKKGQFPFYKVSDISRAIEEGKKYILEARNYIESDVLDEIRGKPIPTGTIIFAKIGEAIRSNRRVVTTKPAVIDNNTAGVKAIETKSSDEFLFYIWSNVSLIDHAGGVVPAVSKSALEDVSLCYPSDPEEQQRIADCLGSLDDLNAVEGQKLDALRQHKQGLMQQLFPSLEQGPK